MEPDQSNLLGSSLGSAEPTFETRLGPLLVPVYELAQSLVGDAFEAEGALVSAILGVKRTVPRTAGATELRRALVDQVVLESQAWAWPTSTQGDLTSLERRLHAIGDSAASARMDTNAVEFARRIFSRTRQREQAVRSRLVRRYAITAMALIAISVAGLTVLRAPTGGPSPAAPLNAASKPAVLARPEVRVQAGPLPTTTGPCIGAGSTFPYGWPSCVSPGAIVGVAYPVLWYDHCGVLPWTEFDGTRFYVASIDPSAVDLGLGGGFPNFIPGMMALTSPHGALFRDEVTGRSVGFVDSLPGEVGSPYPFQVAIYPDWTSLETAFAGRLWTSGPLPPDLVPPRDTESGPPTPRIVAGTITLVSDTQAQFAFDGDRGLNFSVVSPMCA